MQRQEKKEESAKSCLKGNSDEWFRSPGGSAGDMLHEQLQRAQPLGRAAGGALAQRRGHAAAAEAITPADALPRLGLALTPRHTRTTTDESLID